MRSTGALPVFAAALFAANDSMSFSPASRNVAAAASIGLPPLDDFVMAGAVLNGEALTCAGNGADAAQV